MRRRETKRRAIAGAGWILGIVAVLILSATMPDCVRREPPRAPAPMEAPRSGGTLRILSEVPGTLDPIYVDDVYEGAVVNQIYDGLVELDNDLSVVPALAESWVVAEDGRRYEFRLRPGVHFHDGRPLTAECVVFSIERALDPRKRQPCLAETYLSGIEGAKEFQSGRAPHVRGLRAEGSDTVLLRLEEPLSFFLSVLCMDQLKIVPSGTMEGALDRNPVGTGPFRFARHRPDGGVDLTRNERTWGTPALVDSLDFVAGSKLGAEEEVAKLLRHEVDAVSISSGQRALLEGKAGFEIRRSPDVGVTFLGLNLRRPPLDRLEVRQALAMALDRVKLMERGGSELETATGILPPRLAGYQPTSKVLPYDPAQAREKLVRAGYTRYRPLPPIDFYTNRSGTPWLAEELARQLAEVGIRLRTHEVGWPELDRRITDRTAPLFTLSWVADVPDPDAFLYFLFRTGESNNLFAFSDPEVDSLLALGRRTKPGPDRFAAYRRVESRVLDLVPMIPLYHAGSLYAWNPSVRGVVMNPFGFALTPFRRIWFSRPPELQANGAGKRP